MEKKNSNNFFFIVFYISHKNDIKNFLKFSLTGLQDPC